MNWGLNNASLKHRDSLTVWLDPEPPWQAVSSGRAGWSAVISHAAIQFCLALKCMLGLGLGLGLGLRRTVSAAVGDAHFHPIESCSFRITVTTRFN